MAGLKVAEIFGPTLQGEGYLIGTPCYFVRLGGCDYRCLWCDSLHAVLPEAVRALPTMTEDQISSALAELPGYAKWVILSGGNPLVWDLTALVEDLHAERYKVSVETQGSIWKDWLLDVNHVCLSPKPPSSGMPDAHPDWVERLSKVVYQLEVGKIQHDLKIVIFSEDDLDFARLCRKLFPHTTMYLSVGTYVPGTPYVPHSRPDQFILERTARFWEIIKNDHDLGTCRLLPQYHVLLWGHARGV